MGRAVLFLLWSVLSVALQANSFDGSATRGNLSVWRINHHNAQVSLCSYEGNDVGPICYPGSAVSPEGDYTLLPGDDLLSIWRINRVTGQVSMCEYMDVSKPPNCTPWG